MTMLIFVSLLVVVGFLTGTTGIGGILIPPILEMVMGVETHVAMGTGLFAFLFFVPVSLWMYWKMDLLEWKESVPLCIGGLLFSYAGAALKAQLPATTLNIILACLIMFAGTLVFFPVKPGNTYFFTLSKRVRQLGLFGIGAFVGVMAGLTGAGGPVLSIPIMILLGYTPIMAIVAGQIFALSAAITGSVGNYMYGGLDIGLGVFIGLVQVVGLIIGIRLASSCNQVLLKRMVGVVAIVMGVYIFTRAVMILA